MCVVSGGWAAEPGRHDVIANMAETQPTIEGLVSTVAETSLTIKVVV